MKKNSRKRVMRQLRKIVNGYIQCTSDLSEHLALTNDVDFIAPCNDSNEKIPCKNYSIPVNVIDEISKNIESIGYEEEVHNKVDFDNDLSIVDDEISLSASSCEYSDCEDNVEEDALEVQNDFHKDESGDVFSDGVIPKWLLICARKGKIQSCVIDILSLKQYFCPPQVEDYSCNPSHFISLKILSTIVGILLGQTDSLVKYWIRSGSQLEWYTVEPIYETVHLKFPPCDEILEVSESLRKITLLEAADISIDLTLFPEDWHIFIIAILFWLKHMKEPVATESHLHTMVMCLVAIYAIDCQIGVHRNKNTFTRKYKNFLNKVIDSRNKEKVALKNSYESFTRVQQNKDKEQTFVPLKELENITREDCVLMFEKILPYHHLSEQLKAKPKLFCLTTVHAFAQFQSCLFHLMVLNSVLGFPLQDVCVSRLYSGTFAYNIYQKLSKCNNVNVYVESLFHASPSLLNLYRSVIHLMKSSLAEVCLHQKAVKINKKKKKQNNTTIVANTLNRNISEDMEDNDNFFDENNVFSRLSLNVLS